MITFSDFIRHYGDNRKHLPATVAREVSSIALERCRARYAAGRADGPLDFGDLIARIETAIAPRA